jgi:site-specific DNA recombinase
VHGVGDPASPLRGRPTGSGRRAFGHTHDRREIVEDEAEAIRDAARRVLAGETLSSVIRSWNQRGLRTATGGPWRVNSLSTLLLQPRLAGLDGDLQQLPADVYPPILDVGTHSRLVTLHQSRRKGSRRATRHYLLTGLLRCWRCGGGLRGMSRSQGSDLYACPGPPHGGCSGTAITADRADEAILDLVLAHLDSEDFVASVARPSEPDDEGTAQVVSELAAHRLRLQELADLWAAGEIDRAEWLSLRRNIAERAREAEEKLARSEEFQALRRLAGTGSAVRRAWPELTSDERREILHAAVDHIVVLPAEPGRHVFRPERLRTVWKEWPATGAH